MTTVKILSDCVADGKQLFSGDVEPLSDGGAKILLNYGLAKLPEPELELDVTEAPTKTSKKKES